MGTCTLGNGNDYRRFHIASVVDYSRYLRKKKTDTYQNLTEMKWVKWMDGWMDERRVCGQALPFCFGNGYLFSLRAHMGLDTSVFSDLSSTCSLH